MSEIIKPEWKIYKPEQSIEIINELDEALKIKDTTEVSRILKDPKILRSLVVERGEGDKNLNLLLQSFKILLQEKFGSEKDVFDIQGEDLVKMLHEYDLPEQILSELLDTAYHKRDRLLFFRILSNILDNSDLIQNKEIISRAKHDWATWESSEEGESQKAIDLNKEALGGALEIGDEVLAQKVKTGLTFNKNLRPRTKADNFRKIEKNMDRLEAEYDAARARIEEARCRLELSSGQKGSVRIDNLDRASVLAKDAYGFSLESKYGNLEVLALKLLADISQEKGDKRSAERFSKKYLLAKEKYRYKESKESIGKK